jgi:hypothetical protein
LGFEKGKIADSDPAIARLKEEVTNRIAQLSTT